MLSVSVVGRPCSKGISAVPADISLNLNVMPFSMVLRHVPFLTTFLERHYGHMGFMKVIRSFAFSSMSIMGMLLIRNAGDKSMETKSSSDVDILLNSVYGAFLSRMSWNVKTIFHDSGSSANITEKSTKY